MDVVARIVKREFSIDKENSVDKRTALDPDRFGYLSLHYICQLDQVRANLTEYQAYNDFRFEVQIRSILQHAWAEIEHDLGYKTEIAVPRTIRRRFSRLAGLLELADDEFFGIRKEIAAYQRTANIAISKGNLQIEINGDSLNSFVESNPQIHELDVYLASKMKHRYTDAISKGYMNRQVARLVNNGLTRIDQLDDLITKENDLIRKFGAQWLELADDEGSTSSSTTTVPKGVTIFYITLLNDAKKYAEGQIEKKELEFPNSAERYRKAWQNTLGQLDR